MDAHINDLHTQLKRVCSEGVHFSLHLFSLQLGTHSLYSISVKIVPTQSHRGKTFREDQMTWNVQSRSRRSSLKIEENYWCCEVSWGRYCQNEFVLLLSILFAILLIASPTLMSNWCNESQGKNGPLSLHWLLFLMHCCSPLWYLGLILWQPF